MLRTLATLVLVCGLGVSALGQEPPRPPMPPMPGGPPGAGSSAPAESEPEDVRLETADGMSLAATVWRAADEGGPGVVLLHMYRSDRSAWKPLIRALRDRGFSVVALDLRGHGESAKQGGKDLTKRVEERDEKLFRAMHADALAGIEWLVEEAGCDAERIGLVGASVGCSVAIDTAARHPERVAAVACLTPGSGYLGVDTLAHVEKLSADLPLLCLSHESELAAGSTAIVEARPTTALLTFTEEAPADAGRGWAHGTRMFGRMPLVEHTVASFVASRVGATGESAVLDGVLTEAGTVADGWGDAERVTRPGNTGWVDAYRVGRRIVFGGRTPRSKTGLRFQVMTGSPAASGPMVGPPQVVAIDLEAGRVTWSFGGMGSMPNLPGMDPRTLFGKTYPTLRVVEHEHELTFEGEWFVPPMGGDSSAISLVAWIDDEPKQRSGPGVEADIDHVVRLTDRAAE